MFWKCRQIDVTLSREKHVCFVVFILVHNVTPNAKYLDKKLINRIKNKYSFN